jgi:hypothetical protein
MVEKNFRHFYVSLLSVIRCSIMRHFLGSAVGWLAHQLKE